MKGDYPAFEWLNTVLCKLNGVDEDEWQDANLYIFALTMRSMQFPYPPLEHIDEVIKQLEGASLDFQDRLICWQPLALAHEVKNLLEKWRDYEPVPDSVIELTNCFVEMANLSCIQEEKNKPDEFYIG